MRRAKRICIALALGVVTTIAVAWACALLVTMKDVSPGWGVRDTRLFVCRAVGLGRDRVYQMSLQHGLPQGTVLVETLSQVPLPFGADYCDLEASGWDYLQLAGLPFRCLKFKSVSRSTSYWRSLYDGGIQVLRPTTHWRGLSTTNGRVPVHPIWAGMMLDSGIWAAPWYVLLVQASRMVRYLRRRRGLCPRCAYDLKGLAAGAKCPECGKA